MDNNLYNTLNKEQLIKKISLEQFGRLTFSFYKYFNVEYPVQKRNELYQQFNKLNILGRIYIAKEGINAQISVPKYLWNKFASFIAKDKDLHDVHINKAVVEGKSFYKLKIKVKNEIVAYGMQDAEFAMQQTGDYLNTEEFNNAIESSEAIVVDMRNKYESAVGHFQDAVIPNVNTSRELLGKVKELLTGKEDETILLYCTGGVRCEKASSFLIKQGFKNVKQLKGGIIKYANDIRQKNISSKFIGKNFVFDARLGERITDDVLAECYICKQPADNHSDCNNQICHILFIACEACNKQYEGCCSYKCQKIADLPTEEQRLLRKNKD